MLRRRYKRLPLWEGGRRIWESKPHVVRVPVSKGPLGAVSLLSFAFYLVGDLVYLVEDVAVAVYKVGDFGVGVHDGGVVATAEGASDLW